MKIRPVGAELFHADRQTAREDKANSSFLELLQKGLKTENAGKRSSSNHKT
jgi:hypothetical protein